MSDFAVQTVFALAVVLALAGAVEWAGLMLFAPWAFHIGIRVMDERRQLPVPRLEPGATFEVGTAKLKLIAPDECLFRTRANMFGFQTSFPLRGSVRWDGGFATVEAHLPLAAPIWSGLWIVGLAAVAIWSLVSGEGNLSSAGFLLLAMLVVGGAWAFTIPVELRRTRKMLDEMHGVLASGEPNKRIERTAQAADEW